MKFLVVLIAALILVSGATLGATLPSAALPYADEVIVKKSERKLQLIKGGKPYRTYKIVLGFSPVGHKQKAGDGKTPEGQYFLDWRNPDSRFYKSIHISYPNAGDRRNARKLGVSPGGLIMIHGQPNPDKKVGNYDNYRGFVVGEDWTEGCIAVSNMDMDEIWQATRDETPIRILP
jgi:murein L,D-transpeptidase YafK